MRLIIRDIIPIIVLIIVLFMILRVLYNNKYHKNYSLKDIYYLFYIIYFIFLFYVVTYDGLLDFNPEINLLLFREIFRYPVGSYLFFKNVLGNIIIFIPYGILIKYQFNTNFIKLIIVTIMFSGSIEITQLLIGRVFDIDDILLNLIGSLIGYLLIKECIIKYYF